MLLVKNAARGSPTCLKQRPGSEARAEDFSGFRQG